MSTGGGTVPPPAAVSQDDARETVEGEDRSGSDAVAEVSGPWKIDSSIGSFDDFSGSFAGYRVDEDLATIGSSTAVGRTPNVSGEIVIDGNELTEATVTVDLTMLESDESFRDSAAPRALATGEFPDAVFVTTEPIDLGADPGEGSAVETTTAGELTLHGETRPVRFDIVAELIEGVITVTGSTTIDMTDYGITPPQAGPVLAISDEGEIEFQLFFTPR
jgi:polyisoprenoid-binding protein YceI